MGVAGGLVPSPSALIVLLSAIALGRTWFCIVLVIGYGVGMAFVLTLAGILLVKVRDRYQERMESAEGRVASGLRRWGVLAPYLTAGLVLVVGLGAPKQDHFIHTYRDRMPGVELLLPLGGTIDYEAGEVKRPAPWVTNVGLEWFWRVLSDPKTRWKRYFVEQPPVLWKLVRQRLGRYRDPWT